MRFNVSENPYALNKSMYPEGSSTVSTVVGLCRRYTGRQGKGVRAQRFRCIHTPDGAEYDGGGGGKSKPIRTHRHGRERGRGDGVARTKGSPGQMWVTFDNTITTTARATIGIAALLSHWPVAHRRPSGCCGRGPGGFPPSHWPGLFPPPRGPGGRGRVTGTPPPIRVRARTYHRGAQPVARYRPTAVTVPGQRR